MITATIVGKEITGMIVAVVFFIATLVLSVREKFI